jgi:prepilin-type N-terminal cleavage/methylation domain-containing protein
MSKINLKKGFTLIEVLVAIPIFVVVLGSLIVASNLYLSGAGDTLKNTEGAYLAQEGIEAVKILRDYNWTNITSLSTTTNYYLTWDTSSTTWKATTTASAINSFIRTFGIGDVKRDSNGKIVSSGGTFDTNTKKVTVSVSWRSKNGTTTKTLSTYITNIL